METSFAITYADKDGKDFNGIPWMGDAPSSREECLSMAQGLVSPLFLIETELILLLLEEKLILRAKKK